MLCEGAPVEGRINEDACLLAGDERWMYLLVIDGATARVETPHLVNALQKEGEPASPPAFAAAMVKRTLAERIPRLGHSAPLGDLLMEANTALRERLVKIYGSLEAGSILKHEPGLQMLAEDPRLIRMGLPACVVTLARLDLDAHRLFFAHAGDTAMFLFHKDGRITQITDDANHQHDEQALKTAIEIQHSLHAPHLGDVLQDPGITRTIRDTAIFHNYVDEQGRTDPKLGVGVVNGLPQLADYIQAGSVGLDGIGSLLVCSDGFLWPARLEETASEKANRLRSMRQRIEGLGLAGYFTELRKVEEHDASRDLFPRPKVHDDATAIFVELMHE